MDKNMENLRIHLEDIEKGIGYSFKNRENLILALTHSSFANENRYEKAKSNERLEFLGDSILNFIITEKIYSSLPYVTEGEMTKVRANIVCEQSLMKCSNELQLGKYLLLGKGEEITGGRTRVSILSDAFEALLAAIYIDGGMDNAKAFINKFMDKIVEDASCGILFMDYKTQLQEIVQKNGENKISYDIVEEKGPDHNKLFVSNVKIGDKVMGAGEGKSKKEAEQNAARTAISRFE